MTTTLFVGGARSGKSNRAQAWVTQQSERASEGSEGVVNGAQKSVYYIATADRRENDKEMDDRITRHQASRPAHWLTIEEPIKLVSQLSKIESGSVVMIDCVTIWLMNICEHSGWNEAAVLKTVDQLVDTLQTTNLDLALVTNEIGSGVVPMHDMARAFRDVQGLTNQKLAAGCNRVIEVVVGIERILKDAPA